MSVRFPDSAHEFHRPGAWQALNGEADRGACAAVAGFAALCVAGQYVGLGRRARGRGRARVHQHDDGVRLLGVAILGALFGGLGAVTPEEVRATARAYRTEPVFFSGMGHNVMLEPGWDRVARRIAEWLARPNFRAHLPKLMHGEDPDFTAYMREKSGIGL